MDNYSDIKQKYVEAKKDGATGMLVIDWFPGSPQKKLEYIPIKDKNFEGAAAQIFVRRVDEKNHDLSPVGEPFRKTFDVREFTKSGPNQTEFDLPCITYTKSAFISG